MKHAIRLLVVGAGLALAAQQGLGTRSNETEALAPSEPLAYESIGILNCYSSTGELLPGANGRISIIYRGEAIVTDGQFELPPVDEAVANMLDCDPKSVTALELEDLDVIVSSSNWLVLPGGKKITVTASEIPELQLAVFDATTGAELDQVELIQDGDEWTCTQDGTWQPDGWHLLKTATASPIELAPFVRELVQGSAEHQALVRIGSPGYAWQACRFNPFEPARLEVRLETEARLALEVEPELFDPEHTLVIGNERQGILIELPLDGGPLPELGGLPATTLQATVLSPQEGTFQALASTSVTLTQGGTATAKLQPSKLDLVEVSIDSSINIPVQGVAPVKGNTGSAHLTPMPIVRELGPYGYPLEAKQTVAGTWRLTGHDIPPGEYMLIAASESSMLEYAITVPEEGLVNAPLRIPRNRLPRD